VRSHCTSSCLPPTFLILLCHVIGNPPNQETRVQSVWRVTCRALASFRLTLTLGLSWRMQKRAAGDDGAAEEGDGRTVIVMVPHRASWVDGVGSPANRGGGGSSSGGGGGVESGGGGGGGGGGGDVGGGGDGAGERWVVTRSADWAKDLMLDNLCVRTERAALEVQLEELEAGVYTRPLIGST
jgi:hypothetical protein